MSRHKTRPTGKKAVKSTENTSVIVQELKITSADRSRKHVGHFRSSHQAAESVFRPNRVPLYDLYSDILLDGHLTGIVEKRIDAVLNKQLYFEKSGKKEDSLDELIESTAFSDVLRLIMETLLWGISGIEFIPGPDFRFNEIPRKHIKPEWGLITYDQYGDEGISYAGISNIWVMGKPKDLGLLLKCSPYALWKRGGMSDWAQYVEIFGQPVRIVRYDSYDQKTKMELRQVLDEAGSSLALMIPKQADFDMKDGKTSNGNGELHERFKTALDAEMSIIVLGNTETTSSSRSSGYAQASEHGKQQLEITKKDLKFVQQMLNSPEFSRILASYGYPVQGGRFRFEKEIDLANLKDRLHIDQQVSARVPIGDDYWYNTYGIPKPENYEELKRRAQGDEAQRPPASVKNEDRGHKRRLQFRNKIKPTKAPESQASSEGRQPGNSPVMTYTSRNHPNSGSFFARLRTVLRSFFGLAPLSGGATSTPLDELYGSRCSRCGGHHQANTNLTPSLRASFDSVLEEIAAQLYSEKLNAGQIHAGLYTSTSRRLLDAITAGLGGETFVFDDPRNDLKRYLDYNIHAFSAAKNLTELQVFRDLLFTNEGHRRSFSQFRNAVMDAGHVFNVRYLQTEEGMAQASAQMAVLWENLKDTAEFLEFTTVGDRRVRPEHARLDGFTARTDAAVWNWLFPPLDWECRCTVVPGSPDKAKDLPEDQPVQPDDISPYFRRNVGKTRTIFGGEHPYFQNSIGTESDLIAGETYGMPSVAHLYRNREFPPPAPVENASEWKSRLNTGDIFQRDPLGCQVRFDKRFRGKQPAGYENMMGNSPSIISEPDEVWSTKTKSGIRTQYLKYFQEFPVCVTVDDNMAKTGQVLSKSGQPDFKAVESLRRGVLVYR